MKTQTIAILMMLCTIATITLTIADMFFPALLPLAIFAFLAIKAENRRARRNKQLRQYLQSRHMWIDRRNESDLNALENQSLEQ